MSREQMDVEKKVHFRWHRSYDPVDDVLFVEFDPTIDRNCGSDVEIDQHISKQGQKTLSLKIKDIKGLIRRSEEWQKEAEEMRANGEDLSL